MSTIKKTTLLINYFFIVVLVSACSKGLSDNESFFFPQSQSYQQSEMITANDYYGYGYENSMVSDGERWGPICPLEGEDLSYMQTGGDIAISTPIIERGVKQDYVPCIPPEMVAHNMNNNGRPHMYQMPMGGPQQMNGSGPMYQMPMGGPQQMNSPGPMHQMPMGGHQQMNGPGNYRGENNHNRKTLPVRGVIGGANQDAYLYLDCAGTYIDNKKGCGKNNFDGAMNKSNHPLYADPSSLLGNNGNVMQNDATYGNLGNSSVKTDQAATASSDWVATEGVSLRVLLEEWGDRASWKVVWNSDREYIVEAGAVFRGPFMDVASALIRAFARANPAPQGTFYKGNKVLVINTQEAENAE